MSTFKHLRGLFGRHKAASSVTSEQSASATVESSSSASGKKARRLEQRRKKRAHVSEQRNAEIENLRAERQQAKENAQRAIKLNARKLAKKQAKVTSKATAEDEGKQDAREEGKPAAANAEVADSKRKGGKLQKQSKKSRRGGADTLERELARASSQAQAYQDAVCWQESSLRGPDMPIIAGTLEDDLAELRDLERKLGISDSASIKKVESDAFAAIGIAGDDEDDDLSDLIGGILGTAGGSSAGRKGLKTGVRVLGKKTKKKGSKQQKNP